MIQAGRRYVRGDFLLLGVALLFFVTAMKALLQNVWFVPDYLQS
jgi:hypothetical protein